jgi:hypothetical protein
LETMVFGEAILGPQGSDFQTVGFLLDSSAGSKKPALGFSKS